MEPPKNAKIIDTPTAIMWWDESGILCSINKKVPQPTLEEAKNALIEFKKIVGDKKVCLLSDSTNSTAPNKEMRDWGAEVIPQLVKAVAIISRSALGKMTANLFFSIKKQPYPVKMFNDENEAKEWLKQYL